MKTFRDDTGREWAVVINTTAIKRVRGLLDGFDLLSLTDDGFAGLGKLLADTVQLVDVLYVLCKSEADQRAIDDEAFGALMAGDVVERAANAFIDEYVDFFPASRRDALRKVIAAGRTIQAKAMDHLMTSLDNLDLDALAHGGNGSSGNAPESSESTPALSHSAN